MKAVQTLLRTLWSGSPARVGFLARLADRPALYQAAFRRRPFWKNRRPAVQHSLCAKTFYSPSACQGFVKHSDFCSNAARRTAISKLEKLSGCPFHLSLPLWFLTCHHNGKISGKTRYSRPGKTSARWPPPSKPATFPRPNRPTPTCSRHCRTTPTPRWPLC